MNEIKQDSLFLGWWLIQDEHGSWVYQSSEQTPRAFPWSIRAKILWLPGPLVERCLHFCLLWIP